MYAPAPRSLWLVPGRAPLTRGECGEDGEDSPGGRGGPARANPGRRVPGARGGWRGRRPLLAGRKLAPRQMATVSTRLGAWGVRRTMAGTPRSRGGAVLGASVRVSLSVSGCERSARLTVTLAGPPGARQARSASPSSGSAPPPLLQQLSPRPARLPAPTARRLDRRSSAAPSPSLPSPPLAISPPPAPHPPRHSPHTPLPAPTTTESAGDSLSGSPRTRGRHRGGGPGLAASGRLCPRSRPDRGARPAWTRKP
ncbi:POLG alternative reading frame [Odocoileus virginianus]|uniref:POLG alternative reading frame n=1 Tax=Odocoileus virginianus TaxID=9874 RepID=A0ABM4IHD3_ODOVR